MWLGMGPIRLSSGEIFGVPVVLSSMWIVLNWSIWILEPLPKNSTNFLENWMIRTNILKTTRTNSGKKMMKILMMKVKSKIMQLVDTASVKRMMKDLIAKIP